MQLDVVQDKIVKSRPCGVSLIRGEKHTGKSTTAIYRALYLKNNYCLFNEDRILIVAKDEEHKRTLKEIFSRAETSCEHEYRTLFSRFENLIDIETIKDIAKAYFESYIKEMKVQGTIIRDNEYKISIIDKSLQKIKEGKGNIKILDSRYLNFFNEEISWVKACGETSLEEYQTVERTGRRYEKGQGPARLLKNSKERQAVFEVMMEYDKKLGEGFLFDEEDFYLMALVQAGYKCMRSYSHVIIDDAEELTRVQLELLKTILNKRPYSSILCTLNKENSINKNAWIIKGRKLSKLDLGPKFKNYKLSKTFKEVLQQEEYLNMKNEMMFPNSIENYEYVDIRHNIKYNFLRDVSNVNEIIVNKTENMMETYSEDELKGLPMYSDIAAGEPIYMSDEQESTFYMPQFWFNGIRDCFMLKVRGSSMIGANIHDGDFVVLRRQHTAQNGDIVAVDLEGSATLKRLSIKKGIITLMPENENYSPIPINDREAVIIGIAVGIVKNRN